MSWAEEGMEEGHQMLDTILTLVVTFVLPAQLCAPSSVPGCHLAPTGPSSMEEEGEQLGQGPPSPLTEPPGRQKCHSIPWDICLGRGPTPRPRHHAISASSPPFPPDSPNHIPVNICMGKRVFY